ncbi:MAG: hypothetical protein ACXACI_12515 [Candidatus Hodarchaeales archaeon]
METALEYFWQVGLKTVALSEAPQDRPLITNSPGNGIDFHKPGKMLADGLEPQNAENISVTSSLTSNLLRRSLSFLQRPVCGGGLILLRPPYTWWP